MFVDWKRNGGYQACFCMITILDSTFILYCCNVGISLVL
jgi:hypothetical protein